MLRWLALRTWVPLTLLRKALSHNSEIQKLGYLLTSALFVLGERTQVCASTMLCVCVCVKKPCIVKCYRRTKEHALNRMQEKKPMFLNSVPVFMSSTMCQVLNGKRKKCNCLRTDYKHRHHRIFILQEKNSNGS